MFVRAFRNEFRKRGISREPVAVVTDPSGLVIGWKKMTAGASAPTGTVTALAPTPGATSAEVASLRRQLATMTDAQAQQAAAFAELQKKLTELATTVASLHR